MHENITPLTDKEDNHFASKFGAESRASFNVSTAWVVDTFIQYGVNYQEVSARKGDDSRYMSITRSTAYDGDDLVFSIHTDDIRYMGRTVAYPRKPDGFQLHIDEYDQFCITHAQWPCMLICMDDEMDEMLWSKVYSFVK